MIEINPPISPADAAPDDLDIFPDTQPVLTIPTDEIYAPSGLTDEVRDHRTGKTRTIELNNLQVIELFEVLEHGSQGVFTKSNNGTTTVFSKRPTELQAKYRQMHEDEYGQMQPVYSWQR